MAIEAKLKQESHDYLSKQLITYIGNKRALLPFIGEGLKILTRRLNKRKLKIFDIFSGSGVVARYFKQFSEKLIVNDLETYSMVTNKCYLHNFSSTTELNPLKELYDDIYYKLKTSPFTKGVISRLYAPEDDKNIKIGERVFYTTRNAEYIDTVIGYIENISIEQKHFFLAPLLSEASIHTNTAGIFKGYYKAKSGIGKFGGNNGDALFRIKGNIDLPFPIFSNFSCDIELHQSDANRLVDSVDEVDVAYIDPPYNQHPYGSNYFMLNLLCNYGYPKEISPVSGIPYNWNRSEYNKRGSVKRVFFELINKLKAKFLLISFNSEGFISLDSMVEFLGKVGKVNILETRYNTFRGSRNLQSRDIHVKEYLYLVEKG